MAKNTMCKTTNSDGEEQLKNGEEQLKNIVNDQNAGSGGTDSCDSEKENEKDENAETRWILGNDWTIVWPKPVPPEQTPK